MIGLRKLYHTQLYLLKHWTIGRQSLTQQSRTIANTIITSFYFWLPKEIHRQKHKCLFLLLQDEGITLQEMCIYMVDLGKASISSMERLNLVISWQYLKLLKFDPRTATSLFETTTVWWMTLCIFPSSKGPVGAPGPLGPVGPSGARVRSIWSAPWTGLKVHVFIFSFVIWLVLSDQFNRLC